MAAVDDLQCVRVGEQIAPVPHVRGVVRTGRGKRREPGGGGAAADHDAARSASGDEGQVRRESGERIRIVGETAREYPAVKVFSTFGEKTCVSCTLATCARRLT